MKKQIHVVTGFLPEDTIKYKGQHIYKVKSFREGEKGLGPDYPQAQYLELELEGKGGIKGKLEKEIAITPETPLDCRNHKYYCTDVCVWIKNLGGLKYVTDWTPEERWAIAEERTYDDNGNVVASRELGFMLIQCDRKNGIIF